MLKQLTAAVQEHKLAIVFPVRVLVQGEDNRKTVRAHNGGKGGNKRGATQYCGAGGATEVINLGVAAGTSVSLKRLTAAVREHKPASPVPGPGRGQEGKIVRADNVGKCGSKRGATQ